MEIDSSDDDQSVEMDHGTDLNMNLIAGKIVKIHVKNFLTHTEAIVHPTEHLNLVSMHEKRISWYPLTHVNTLVNFRLYLHLDLHI